MSERYGDEWKRELMKNPKSFIVERLRHVAMERDDFHTELARLRVIEEAAKEVLAALRADEIITGDDGKDITFFSVNEEKRDKLAAALESK